MNQTVTTTPRSSGGSRAQQAHISLQRRFGPRFLDDVMAMVDDSTHMSSTTLSPDWLETAKCKVEGKPLDFFFPELSKTLGNDVFNEAKKYCAGCPVKVECLATALLEERDAVRGTARFGVRGGTSPVERSKMNTAYGDRIGKVHPRTGKRIA